MNTIQIAEIKGYLCGFICSGAQSEGQLWLEALSGSLQSFDSDNSTQPAMLIEMYKQVSEDILNQELGLSETIFEKSLPLITRAYALKKWCNGFISGLVQSGLPAREMNANTNLTEKLQRFEGISDLDINALELSENDEKMFQDVAQFIEAAVLQIYKIFHQVPAKH